MDEIRTGIHFDRLTKRRTQLLSTLQHLDKEQVQVERNTDWIDQAAYESRVALLDRLNDWYLAEMAQIDRALERFKRHNYGNCAACHQAIEIDRLEIAPEAEFCSACQDMRDQVVQE
jgi:DnaK suppressor protein